MIGGLCLFLFGMTVMGDSLERRVGNSLKKNNPLFQELYTSYSEKYTNSL